MNPGKKPYVYMSKEMRNAYELYHPVESAELGNRLITVSVEDSETGMVCMDCGSRGEHSPILITGHCRAIVFSDTNGIRICIDLQHTKKKLRELASGNQLEWIWDYTAVSSKCDMIARCGNCNGSVISASLAISRCHDRGCGGCVICSDMEPYNIIITDCSACSLGCEAVKGEWTREMFFLACADEECPTLFVRDSIYHITAWEISKWQKGEIL